MRLFNAHNLWQALTRQRVFHVDVTLRAHLVVIIFGMILLLAGVVWFTDTRGASDVMELSESTPQGPGLERYVDSVRGFFFDYPDTLSLSVTEVGENHTILGDTPEGKTVVLIVVSPYLLDEPFTEDTIRAQPSAVDISSDIERLVLPSGAIAFLSQRDDTPFGASRDALFVDKGTLYQVSVVVGFEDLFNQILQSWRFTSPSTP